MMGLHSQRNIIWPVAAACTRRTVKDVLWLLELHRRMAEHLGAHGCEVVAHLSKAYAGEAGEAGARRASPPCVSVTACCARLLRPLLLVALGQEQYAPTHLPAPGKSLGKAPPSICYAEWH